MQQTNILPDQIWNYNERGYKLGRMVTAWLLQKLGPVIHWCITKGSG